MNKKTIDKTKRPAFTLVEIIIYIALTTMVLVSFLRVTLSVMTAREQVGVRTTVQQEMRFALDRIIHAVHQSTDVNQPNSVFNDDNGVLELTMNDASKNPTRFSLSLNRILIQEGVTDPMYLTSSGVVIDQLRFEDLTPVGSFDTVSVLIHGNDGSLSDEKTYIDELTLRSAASLRQ